MFSLKYVSFEHPELPDVLVLSVGNSDKLKLQRVLGSYNSQNAKLVGCFCDKKLVGIIGFTLKGHTITIKHIAVLPEYRSSSIGSKLIQSVKEQSAWKNILAETDNEAVGFYERCHFKCVSFQGPYGERYRCELKKIS